MLVKDPGLVEYRMKSTVCETDSSGRMSGANMILVTVNVMLGKNDPEPDQHLDPVSLSITVLRGADWFHIQGEHIIKRVVALRDFPATIKGILLRESSSEGSLVQQIMRKRVSRWTRCLLASRWAGSCRRFIQRERCML